MSSTPTLDKFNLHPLGGRCTCITHPYSKCSTCEAIKNLQARWARLSPENRQRAMAEHDAMYATSNQDGR